VLEVRDLSARYGAIEALRGVSLRVSTGQLVALIGSNGAGKTTLMRVISGIVDASEGDIWLDGESLRGVKSHARVARGVAHVPEGRHVFGDQNVRDNLELGAFGRSSPWSDIEGDMERMFGIFPRLRERASQLAGTLSGGEQQMLAIARALMSRPKLLLLDEPSLGLAPIIVRQIYDFIGDFARASGATVLIAEQMATIALKVADRGVALRRGRVVLAGSSAELLAEGTSGALAATYL
jgi:branched-chain amino acid transport system ATP-binding protein